MLRCPKSRGCVLGRDRAFADLPAEEPGRPPERSVLSVSCLKRAQTTNKESALRSCPNFVIGLRGGCTDTRGMACEEHVLPLESLRSDSLGVAVRVATET